MRDLIIYGAGGFGRETALMINQINTVSPAWKVVGFCDDNLKKGATVCGLPVIGGISELNGFPGPVAVAIAVADPALRKKIRNSIQNPGVNFPVLIHPGVLLGDLEVDDIGEGSIITAGNILTTNIQIKRFVIVNLSCTIGHDVVIHDFCSIMPGCSISGVVTLESEVQLGTGSRVLPGLKVAEKSRVGAGAVVTRNIPRDVTVVGVPAKAIG